MFVAVVCSVLFNICVWFVWQRRREKKRQEKLQAEQQKKVDSFINLTWWRFGEYAANFTQILWNILRCDDVFANSSVRLNVRCWSVFQLSMKETMMKQNVYTR